MMINMMLIEVSLHTTKKVLAHILLLGSNLPKLHQQNATFSAVALITFTQIRLWDKTQGCNREYKKKSKVILELFDILAY